MSSLISPTWAFACVVAEGGTTEAVRLTPRALGVSCVLCCVAPQLRFEPIAQRLRLIDVYDCKRLVMSYHGASWSGPGAEATFIRVYDVRGARACVVWCPCVVHASRPCMAGRVTFGACSCSARRFPANWNPHGG